MNKPYSNKILIFLKIFCFMFSICFVFSIITFLILNIALHNGNKSIGSTISFTLAYSFFFSIFASLHNVNNYINCSKKVMYENAINKDLILELQKIMKKMHWSVKRNDSKQIIFKSSIFRTLWPESLNVIIAENTLELVGSKYLVEKLFKELIKKIKM